MEVTGMQTPRVRKLLAESSLEIPPSPCLKKLGFGTGVRVLLYERSPRMGQIRSPWAVKKVNRTHSKGPIAERLEQEAIILRDLKHPNIIGFRGFKRSSDGSQMLLVESGESSLFDIIEEVRESQLEQNSEDDFRSKPLPADKILFIIKSVASALDYLHTEKRLLHGDLKSSNILVAGDYDSVKLCDFGVSLHLNEKGIVDDPKAQYIGTEPWSALEVFHEETITTKTDIFSLGCVIFEMIALDTPHCNKLSALDDDEDFDEDEYEDSEYQEALGHRPDLPEYVEDLGDDYEPVLSLFYACTSDDPEQRPSARQIVDIVSKLKEPTTTAV